MFHSKNLYQFATIVLAAVSTLACSKGFHSQPVDEDSIVLSSTHPSGSSGTSTQNPSPAPAPAPTPAPNSPLISLILQGQGPGYLTPPAPTGRVLRVGPQKQYPTLTAAVAASTSGDTIQIDAGTYTNDFPGFIGNNITIEGVGGMAHLVATTSIPNRKGLLDINADVTLYNLEISGAFVSNGDGANGAAIRYEGGHLTIKHCYFHDNQEGLLGGASAGGSITVDASEFAKNGVSDGANYPAGYGYTHNIYVGHIDQFTATNSYFFGANVGHEIKSRALNNTIDNCVIADGAGGTASYSIDLPNGGNAVITNNIIEKGPNRGNPVMITMGEEGASNTTVSITISNNVLLNDASSSTVAIRNSTSTSALVSGNSFYNVGAGQILSGAGAVTASTILAIEPYLIATWVQLSGAQW